MGFRSYPGESMPGDQAIDDGPWVRGAVAREEQQPGPDTVTEAALPVPGRGPRRAEDADGRDRRCESPGGPGSPVRGGGPRRLRPPRRHRGPAGGARGVRVAFELVGTADSPNPRPAYAQFK